MVNVLGAKIVVFHYMLFFKKVKLFLLKVEKMSSISVPGRSPENSLAVDRIEFRAAASSQTEAHTTFQNNEASPHLRYEESD